LKDVKMFSEMPFPIVGTHKVTFFSQTHFNCINATAQNVC
jgi:hypothetical protein